MSPAAISAKLRRAAFAADAHEAIGTGVVYNTVYRWRGSVDELEEAKTYHSMFAMWKDDPDAFRTFLLLVAEAL